MEGSVKERLTGALIFVAAVVIVVPEMFSGPGERRAPVEMATGLADGAAPVHTYSMPVDGAAEPGAVVAAPAAMIETVQPAEAPPAELQANASQETVPQAAAQAGVPSQPAGAVAATASTPAPAPPPAKQQQAPVGNWWTQVGIFSSRENAEKLTKKLRADGFSVEIGKYASGGKDMFRVRVGPVKDRQEAEALLARLRAAGQVALLVSP